MPGGLVIIGAGGHAAVVESALRLAGGPALLGFLDDGRPKGSLVCQGTVLGPLSLLPSLREWGTEFFHVAIGGCETRLRLFDQAVAAGLKPLTIVHPAAFCDPFARVGEGSFLAAGSFVGPRAVLGRGVILNTHATADHDCVLGDFCHVCPGTNLAGAVEVGPLATIGTGSAAIPMVKVGAGALVGAGSVIVEDVAPMAKAFGNPCRQRGEAPALSYGPALELVRKGS